MPFEEALMLVKMGHRVARSGWNAKGMFVYLVGPNSYSAQAPTIKGYFDGDMVPYGAYMAMKTAKDNVMPWTPSQCDILADDWCLVD
jgi:hypothetical protein